MVADITLKKGLSRLIVQASFAAVVQGLFDQAEALRSRFPHLGIADNELHLANAVVLFWSGRVDEARAALSNASGPDALELASLFDETLRHIPPHMGFRGPR